MPRKIFISRETEFNAKRSPNKSVSVYSFFPVDKADCPCQVLINKWKRDLAQENDKNRRKMIERTSFLVCPREKTNMHRYEVICGKCGARQGLVWATDATLKDWCDFHYTQWTIDNQWKGCLTPHISPITQELCLECCCGNDTRDFRANMQMNQRTAERLEEKNVRGRGFNHPNSAFLVRKITKT